MPARLLIERGPHRLRPTPARHAQVREGCRRRRSSAPISTAAGGAVPFPNGSPLARHPALARLGAGALPAPQPGREVPGSLSRLAGGAGSGDSCLPEISPLPPRRGCVRRCAPGKRRLTPAWHNEPRRYVLPPQLRNRPGKCAPRLCSLAGEHGGLAQRRRHVHQRATRRAVGAAGPDLPPVALGEVNV